MRTVTNIRIDEITRRDFHIWCIQNGTTIAENLRNHINDTLGKRPQPQIKKTGWLSGSNDTDSGLNDRWESSY